MIKRIGTLHGLGCIVHSLRTASKASFLDGLTYGDSLFLFTFFGG